MLFTQTQGSASTTFASSKPEIELPKWFTGNPLVKFNSNHSFVARLRIVIKNILQDEKDAKLITEPSNVAKKFYSNSLAGDTVRFNYREVVKLSELFVGEDFKNATTILHEFHKQFYGYLAFLNGGK